MNDIAISPIRRSAIDLYNQAVTAANSDKNLCYRLIGSSVEVDPTFQPGWFQIGCNNGDLGLLNSAVAAFRRSLELKPDDPKCLVNIGHKLHHMGNMREAREFTERAVRLDPNLAFGWCNLSLIDSVENKMKAAVRHARQAFELDRDCTIETALAFALMFSGEYAEGLKHFESRYEYKLPQFLGYPWPQWRGEDISDKVLFIQSEQGMGDAIGFARFIPLALRRARHVIFMCQAELVRLFHGVFAPWHNITILPLPQPFPQADCWSAPMSLPVALGLTTEEIAAAPNLRLPNLSMPAVWKVSDRKLHIGIAWGGSAANEIDRWRSMRIEHFLELYHVPGIQLYSLQVGDRVQELHNAGAASLVKDLAPFIRDVSDTMAIMRDLDLIITIDTALGHIAGAMEMPCWVLVAYNGGDFRLGRSGAKSLWNPNHRIFRQNSSADWRAVIEDVIKALKEKVR